MLFTFANPPSSKTKVRCLGERMLIILYAFIIPFHRDIPMWVWLCAVAPRKFETPEMDARIISVVHVDDCLVSGNSTTFVKKSKFDMSKKYKLTDLGVC